MCPHEYSHNQDSRTRDIVFTLGDAYHRGLSSREGSGRNGGGGRRDRLRNLIFLRHIENPENVQRQASLQVIFMTQSLERAGDHVKNLAEEVCHFVSGQTVRHVLMTYDKPIEQMFLDWLRTREEQH